MKRRKRPVPFIRSKQWRELRLQALERDGNECCLCRNEQDIVVHHVIYRKGHSELQADMDNLVCVCKRCHFEIHRGIGNFRLMQWLRYNRPRQYNYLLQHV